MKIKLFRVFSVVLLALWMCLIFHFSAQDARRSDSTSGGVIKAVVAIVHPDFERLSAEQQEAIIDSFQFAVRKTAHFTIYAFLGVLAFLSIISYRSLSFYMRPAISAAVCLLYAVSDEIHQFFVPGRSCEVRDMMIDFCGAMLGIIICTLLTRFVRKIYNSVKAAD